MYRTFTCGALTDKNVDEEVVLSGWVHRRRDHGGVIFIDLRDRYGLTQIVSDPIDFKEIHDLMDRTRPEFVLKITGKVRLRPGNNANKNMTTGAIEVLVTKAEILNESLTPPFEIDQDKDVSEELRLKYRYLDLRRDRLRGNIILRHHVMKHIRDYLDGENFIEVETPILIKGTPEGSREYIVPSRLHEGQFYVLPQSPQQLKQLLMVAGFDRYFQIARCFRDEDQRGDRQPEFTQLDMEMSFVEEDEIMEINEGMLIELTKKFAPEKKIMHEPFPVLTYDEALNIYGSDSPDIRFDLPLSDISDIASECGFGIFKSTVTDGGVVKALRVPGGGDFTRKQIDEYCELAKVFGAKGLAYIVVGEELKSPIVKFFEESDLSAIIDRVQAVKGDIIFFCADSFKTSCDTLGRLRLEIAKNMDLIDPNLFAYCWVKDFPMFEMSDDGHLAAVHHPFTAPRTYEELDADPETALAKAYDVVLNGVEIGGGSIRIHEDKVQRKVFDALNISKEDLREDLGICLKHSSLVLLLMVVLLGVLTDLL